MYIHVDHLDISILVGNGHGFCISFNCICVELLKKMMKELELNKEELRRMNINLKKWKRK